MSIFIGYSGPGPSSVAHVVLPSRSRGVCRRECRVDIWTVGHESRLRHCAVGSERQLVGRVVVEGRTHVIGLADTVSDVTDLQFSLVDISGFRFEAFLSRIALAAHAQ